MIYAMLVLTKPFPVLTLTVMLVLVAVAVLLVWLGDGFTRTKEKV